MTFEEWIIANDHDEDGKYPSQNFYSAYEWDYFYDQYEKEYGDA